MEQESMHEALDLKPSSPLVDHTAYAPLGGMIMITELDPREGDYQSSMTIYNKNSGVIVGIRHIKPDKRFSVGQFYKIKEGEKIGEVVYRHNSSVEDVKKYIHLHITVYDPDKEQLVDPSVYLKGYKDKVPPVINTISIYDQDGNEVVYIPSNGKITLSFEAFDESNISNLHHGIIKYNVLVKGDESTTFRCDLSDIANYVYAKDFYQSFQKKESSNIYFPNRLNDSSGVCSQH